MAAAPARRDVSARVAVTGTASRRRAPRGIAARLLLLAVLAVAWADPPLPAGATGWLGGPVDVLVVRDRSAAALRRGGHGTALARALDALPAGSRAALVDFAHGALSVQPLDAPARLRWNHAAGPAASRAGGLAEAVDTAVALAVPGRESRLVLLGDGAEIGRGEGADPAPAVHAALARARDVPLAPTWLDLRAEAAPAGAWIEALAVPGHVLPGSRVPVAVQVGSQGAAAAMLRLQVDGAPVEASPVRLPLEAERLFWIGPLGPGEHEVLVQVSAPGDPVSADDRRAALVRVPGPASVLYLTRSPDPPPLATSLAAGGWPVVRMSPRMLAEGLRGQPALVVLDDVPAHDVAAPDVAALARAVRRHGAGLLVLGGPDAFGAGGYRGSALEALLPVTAQAPGPAAPVAALFLVDTSGSMGRGGAGASALAMARRAVVETAASLEPGDLSGVYGFDVTHRELLPLAPRERPAEQALQALGAAATGGTRLAGALRGAVQALARAPAQRRILLVVSDARLDADDDLADAASQAHAAGIQVLVLLVGDAPRVPALDALARAGGGAVLRIAREAELPRIMRQELDTRRAPAHVGPVVPVQVASPPMLGPVLRWPVLHGFAPTRARDGARVYLVAPGGAPLLAVHDAGAGRVAVLPGGLSGWAVEWLRWPRFGELAGGLASWLSAPGGGGALHLQVHEAGGSLRVVLDALAPGGEWLRDGATLVAVSPGGSAQLALAATAPGRFEAALAAPASGRHVFTARAGGHSSRHVHLQAPAGYDGGTRQQVLEGAAAQGLVKRVTDPERLSLAGGGTARPWLLALAAMGYPLLLALEGAGTRRRVRPRPRYRRDTTSTTGVPGAGVTAGS